MQLPDAVDGEPEQRGQVRDRIEMEVAELMMMTNEMVRAIPMEMEFVIAIETELGA